ncbi:MAG: hypothetical protein LBQ73_08630, partial [Tannerellaceae bacterium]|jgi:hypothetical protein|nr:hypothetical protein [Tannerellaceae bacterium]
LEVFAKIVILNDLLAKYATFFLFYPVFFRAIYLVRNISYIIKKLQPGCVFIPLLLRVDIY